jgi:electron transport complex protein RnfE
MRITQEFLKGLWKDIPVFRICLGLCPTLAVTTTAFNGLGMGAATTFVLVCSNIVISILRNIIPSKVRIPVFIVVIATFVTIVDLVLKAVQFELHQALGIFIPLIVVNCIILGRAEAFASKNPLSLSIADGLGMGIGFTLALFALGAVREILGSGTITVFTYGSINLHYNLLGSRYIPAVIMILPPGAFLALGLMLGLMNKINQKLEKNTK